MDFFGIMVGPGSHQTDDETLKFARQLILQILNQVLLKQQEHNGVLTTVKMCCKLLYGHLWKKSVSILAIKKWDEKMMICIRVPFQSCICTLQWLPASVRCSLRWPGPIWRLYHYLRNTKQHLQHLSHRNWSLTATTAAVWDSLWGHSAYEWRRWKMTFSTAKNHEGVRHSPMPFIAL